MMKPRYLVILRSDHPRDVERKWLAERRGYWPERIDAQWIIMRLDYRGQPSD
jgi:hypothetical protein